MLKQLIKLATSLDEKGLQKQASALDSIIKNNMNEIKKLSGFLDKVHIEETPEFAEYEEREEFESELNKTADAVEFLLKIMDEGKSEDLIIGLTDILISAEHTAFAEALFQYIKDEKIDTKEDMSKEQLDDHRTKFVTDVMAKDDYIITSAEILKAIKDAKLSA